MKYYAVVKGSQQGIFTSWEVTSKLVLGYPGAIYKSFGRLEDAEKFMQEGNAGNRKDKDFRIQRKPTIGIVIPLNNRSMIFTDGSAKNQIAGYGLVLIKPTGDVFKYYGRVPYQPGTNQKAELYAIYASLFVDDGPLQIMTDSEYSINSLTKWTESWVAKDWRGVKNKDLIEPIYILLKDRDVIFRHVKAHSGIKYNEEADRLAKLGTTTDEDIILEGQCRIEM
jgi:ribonuclease HI